MKITITENGPYIAEKDIPVKEVVSVADKDGGVSGYDVQGDAGEPGAEKYLCRCGHSKNKPFCDGRHVNIGFDGTETDYSRKDFREKAMLFRGEVYDALVSDDLCAITRFCDVGSGLGEALESSDEADIKNVLHGGCCPAGRIVLIDKETGQEFEPELDKEIYLINDEPEAHLGPIYVRGGIQVIGADGHEYEIRNRMTLCRCGESSNSPFCDASHLDCEHMKT